MEKPRRLRRKRLTAPHLRRVPGRRASENDPWATFEIMARGIQALALQIITACERRRGR